MTGERYIRAAFAYLYIREFERAIESFGRAIEAEPDNPAYYFHASVTALRNKKLEQAYDWAKTAVQLAPRNELYLEHLDVVQSNMLMLEALQAKVEGRTDDAIRLLALALERDPLNDEAESELTMLNELISRDAASEP